MPDISSSDEKCRSSTELRSAPAKAPSNIPVVDDTSSEPAAYLHTSGASKDIASTKIEHSGKENGKLYNSASTRLTSSKYMTLLSCHVL